VIRLYLLVEGQTEEAFVSGVLAPHLRERAVYATPIIVETSRDPYGRKRRGGGSWQKWHRDLQRLIKSQPGPDVRFSSLFDLYALPGGFPGLSAHGAHADTRQRATLLEGALATSVGDDRFIPYLQRHEFEALVLAGLDELEKLLDDEEDRQGIVRLRSAVGQIPPEDVNDGPETAPSKRLEGSIPSYRKTLHGPLVAEAVGLPSLRRACPRFDAWVSRLEGLATP